LLSLLLESGRRTDEARSSLSSLLSSSLSPSHPPYLFALSPLALPLRLPLSRSPPARRTRADACQVSRALRIKSEYLSKTAGELEQRRKEAEVHAEGGILGLGLLNSQQAQAAGGGAQA